MHTYVSIHRRTYNTKVRRHVCKKPFAPCLTVFLLNKRFGLVHPPLQIKAFPSVAWKQSQQIDIEGLLCEDTSIDVMFVLLKKKVNSEQRGKKINIGAAQVFESEEFSSVLNPPSFSLCKFSTASWGEDQCERRTPSKKQLMV